MGRETEAGQIIDAVETMRQMTREVTQAASRQRQECTKTVEASAEILESSRETAGASQLISHEVTDVERQVEALMESIAFFKDGSPSAEALPPSRVHRCPLLGDDGACMALPIGID